MTNSKLSDVSPADTSVTSNPWIFTIYCLELIAVVMILLLAFVLTTIAIFGKTVSKAGSLLRYYSARLSLTRPSDLGKCLAAMKNYLPK